MDAKNIKNIYKNYADHIIMNLPYTSNEFIESALTSCKTNGIIHYYSMEIDNETNNLCLFNNSINIIKNEAKKLNKKINIKEKLIIRSCGPRKYNIRIDIKVVS